MTKSLLLGTEYDENRVRDITKKLGFTKQPHVYFLTYFHNVHKHLRVQLYTRPTYFEGIKGIVTEIIFDDEEDALLENIAAVEILKQIDTEIPNTRCRESYARKENPTPVMLLHDYLARFQKS